jgi:epidermal growth factor receptor substrate 15
MSDLSGLKELVERAESLESEISKLEDEKSKLSQECITLRAKLINHKSILDGYDKRTAELDKIYQEKKTDLDESVKKFNDQKILLDGQIRQKQAEINQLGVEFGTTKSEKSKILSDLNVKIDAAEASLDHIDSKIEEGNKEVSILSNKKVDLEEDLTNLENKRRKSEESAKETLEYMKIEQLNADKTLKSTKGEIKTANKSLLLVKRDIDKANEELNKAKSEHNSFKKYEELARTALEARETVLLKSEKQLKEAIAVARRRDGVLDKIGE